MGETDRLGYELVVSDLDGTLLPQSGIVSSRTVAAVRAIRADGVRFTVASARPIADLRAVVKALDLRDPVICQNGAVIYSPELSKVLHSSLVGVRDIHRVLRRVRSIAPRAVVAIDYPHFRLADPTWPGPFGGGGLQLPLWPIEVSDLPRRRRASMILLRGLDEESLISDIAGKLRWTTSESGLIEISSRSAEKSAALKRVCDMLQVESKSVVAFGDMPNDALMLESAGLGVAVANAHAAVIEIANTSADRNDDDGVAGFLEGLFNLRPRE